MQHDFTLVANGAQTIDVAGKFFKYKSGRGAIRIKDNRGGSIDLMPGQGVWNVNYTTLMVQDISGAANAGVLLAGDFDFHDDRISGSVEVIDGGRNRTSSNVAFMASGGLGAVAANFPHIQLWNPVGSGKNLVVESVTGTSAAAGSIALKKSTASVLTPSNFGISKLLGGANSIARTYVENNAAALGITPNFIGKYYAANSQADIKLVEPIVIPPGFGLIALGTQNTDFSAFFEYFEDTI